MLTRIDDLLQCGDPNRPAVTFKDETLSYEQLRAEVDRVAAGLHRLGLQRGERVVVYLEKRIETVVALFAVSAAGGVVVPVNPLFKARQVGYIVNDCAARMIITTRERYRTLRSELGSTESLRHVVVVGSRGGFESRPASPRHELITWWQLCELSTSQATGGKKIIDADVVAILYTSGSTGSPKGVVLSHRNVIAGAQSVATYLEHTSDDVILAVLPLSFDAGFSQLTTAFVAGAHVVLENYLLPGEVVRLCARHQITGLTCMPALWLQLAAQMWTPEATKHMRYFANTGGRMPKTVLSRLRSLFSSAKPFLMYGLTEAFRSTCLDPNEVDNRPDSIGKAIPNAEVLVVRPDGTECVPGEEGEIVHRGALVALGYWNDPERTAERFRPVVPSGDGRRTEIAVWSGDIAYRDTEGFIYFIGRTDDMIKTCGYRVSPTEIEEVAYATGLIGEAVAFGAPDDRLGQHVVLAVTGPDGGGCDTETLLKALENDLPTYMVPHRVVVCSELPRSGNGKFDRIRLRRLVTG